MQDGTADKEMPAGGMGPLPLRGVKREHVKDGLAGHTDAQGGIDWVLGDWERAFDAAIDAILLTDCQGRITWANRAASQVLSKPRDEIIGKTWSQATHGIGPSPKDCPLAQAYRTKKHAEGEVYVHNRRAWLEVSAAPVLNDEGDVTGAVQIIRDVTARRRKEEAMRERQKRYRDLFENAREAILLVDRQGSITAVNRFVEEYGFKREELIGKRLFDFVVEDHRARALADFGVLLGGQPVKGEMDVFTPKGVFCIEYRDNPIIRGGQIVGAQALLTDVTAHKRAERLLREERDKAQKYFDIAGVVLIVIDSEQRVGLINKRGCEVLGYAEQEVLGRNWFDHFLPKSVRQEARAAFQSILRGETSSFKRYNHPVRTRTGKERQVIWHNTVLHDDRGEVVAVLGSGEDITEHRRAEEALRLSEERYRGIFENAVLGMYQTTPEGEILAANPALIQMVGYDTFEEFAARNLEAEGFEPEHARSPFQECLEADGQIVGLESAWKRRDGSTLWVRQSARAVRDKAGKILFYEGTVEDITASKHADQLMQTLATTALELVGLPAEADLFQFIGEKVLALIGKGIVSVHSIEGDTLTVRQITGATTAAMKLAQRLLGRAVIGMRMKGLHEVARSSLLTGKLTKVEGGLYEVFFRTVPRAICWTLEKGIGIQECHSIGIRRPGALLGNVTILTQKGTELNARVIEAFVNQASIALERRKAEQELRERTRLNQILLDAMPCVALLLRVGTREIVASNEATRAAGAVVGTTCFGAWAQRSNPCPWCLAPRVWATGQARHLVVESEGVVWDAHWLPVADDLYMHYAFDISDRQRAEEALRESEKKYRELFEDAWEAIVITDMNMTITDANKLVETYGFRKADFLGRNYFDFVAEPYRKKAIADFEVLRRGVPLEGEFEVITPRGRIPVYYRNSPIVRGGHVVGMQSIVMDLTQQRQAEKALRESEERYRLLANNASDVIWTMDLNFRFTYCSPSVRRATGYTPEEVLAKRPDEVLTPASCELVMKVLAEEIELEQTGQADPFRSRTVEAEEIRKDGTAHWVEIRGGFLRDASGKAIGIVGVTRDITKRKKLEHEIVARERYLSSFFTGATAGLGLLDKDLRYVQINDTLAEMNGMPAKDHLGRTVREIVPELAPGIEPILRKVLTTGEPVLNVEVTGQTQDHPGVQRHWVESFFPIAGADGTPEGVGAIVAEITERKKAEQHFLDYQNRLRELTAKLTLAEEQERRRIAVGVHDQIGQRLALVKLALQSLLASKSDPSTRRPLEDVCREVDQVVEDAHSLTFELSNPVLHEAGFVDAVESWLVQQIHDRYGLQCTFDANDRLPTMDKDTGIALFQIVRELLANVVKHAKAKRADVRIHRAGDNVQITVQDDGVGFEPAQVGRPDSRTGGYGLFSVRERLEYLGGTLNLESAPGAGTCISLVVPVPSRRKPRGKEASS